jgi:hypothetical protein
MNPQPAASRLQRFLETMIRGLALTVLVLLAVPRIVGGKNLPAQTNTPQSTKSARQRKPVAKPVRRRRRAAPHAHVAAQAPIASPEPRPAPEAIAAPTPDPPAPIWPANQAPNQAKVTWDSRGLEIEASNSSLDEILHQVAAETGVKFEGLTQDQPIFDQRIFGTYGPGPARDVLSMLLEGSGNNVLIIGGRDADTPLEVVFSVSSPASVQTAENNLNRSNPEDEDAADPPEPGPPPATAMKTPFGNGDSGSPETPTQIMQDVLERQQKIDQQQQNQQNSPQR